MLAHPHDEELDTGPRKIAAGTERLCLATGTVKPVDEMIRFVVDPDGAPVPDLRRRLPGRGVWVSATRAALSTAVARKAFARGFKRDIRVAPDFVAATERLIERAALDALAIAHKAGRVAIGFGKTEARHCARARGRAAQCRRGGAGRGAQARRRAPPPVRRQRRKCHGHRQLCVGAIGFGIGPVKCGTCCPACRSRE